MPQFPNQPATTQVPRTETELRAVMMQREELQSQLRSLGERQQQLMIQRQDALGTNNRAAAEELQSRLTELTQRVARIEREKLAADDMISQALARGVGANDGTPVAVDQPGVAVIPTPDVLNDAINQAQRSVAREYERMMLGGALALVLIGVAAWRWTWRRAAAKIRREVVAQQPAAGTRELKDAVDAIALEVERISENQRFVTRLLSEKQLAEPVQSADANPR